MAEPRETIIVTEDRTVDLSKATYPWLSRVVVHAKGGDAGTENEPGAPGFIILELFD